MLDITILLSEYRQTLDCLEDLEFACIHETFVEQLGYLPEDSIEDLDDMLLAEYVNFFRSCQRRYLTIKEQEVATSLCNLKITSSEDISKQLAAGFGENSYRRVQDLSGMIKLPKNGTVVMVGCGALPATLFWLRDQDSSMKLIGLDIDPIALGLAGKTVQAMSILGIELQEIDGCDFNYAEADLVYLANQVNSKRSVLERIADTGSDVQVVVRDSTRVGSLLATRVVNDLPPRFRIVSTGHTSKSFLSRDLVLALDL
jgi:hypothetical protein